MNIVIPMAGRGSRFATAGYDKPKPFIDLNGSPMISWVVANLNVPGRYIMLARNEHMDMLSDVFDGRYITAVPVNEITDGAARTVLLAEHLIDSSKELLIANSDQLVLDKDAVLKFVSYCRDADADGGIMTFKNDHPKWSYASVRNDGTVERVAEKEVISEHATCGIYYFRRGSDFVWAAKQMIEKNIRTNNEFYLCPVYNELIASGSKIIVYHVEELIGLGTPEDFIEAQKKLT